MFPLRLSAAALLALFCMGCTPPAPEPVIEPVEEPPPPIVTLDNARISFEAVASLTGKEDNGDFALDFVAVPGSTNEYFVGYRDGLIERRRLPGHQVIDVGQLPVRRGNECGLLALEVHPGFRSNKRVYAGYCVPEAGVAIQSFKWPPASKPIAEDDLTPVLALPPSGNDYHNLGDMGFDAKGNLWFTYGDGNTGFPQVLGDLRGKLNRIRPYADGTSGYTIPPDNPFVDMEPDVIPEIVAYGFKSPFRADYYKGDWIIGDVGLEDWEEINVVRSDGGRNFGYPLCEGKYELNGYLNVGRPCPLGEEDNYVAPQLSYQHDNFSQAVFVEDLDAVRGRGWAVVGGIVYEGTRHYHGLMDSRYVYGDIMRGFIRSAAYEDGRLVDDRHLGHLEAVYVFAQGPDGLLYAIADNILFALRIDPPDLPVPEPVLAR